MWAKAIQRLTEDDALKCFNNKKGCLCCNRRMVRAQLKCNPPSKYHIQLPKKGGSKGGQKRCHVIEALIEKRNLKRHSYKVSFVSALNDKMEKKWLMVDDITSLTLKEEKK